MYTGLCVDEPAQSFCACNVLQWRSDAGVLRVLPQCHWLIKGLGQASPSSPLIGCHLQSVGRMHPNHIVAQSLTVSQSTSFFLLLLSLHSQKANFRSQEEPFQVCDAHFPQAQM